MNEITVAIMIEYHIAVRQGAVQVKIVHDVWAINAPEPMGVVAAIAINPPANSRRVPSVSIASRNYWSSGMHFLI